MTQTADTGSRATAGGAVSPSAGAAAAPDLDERYGRGRRRRIDARLGWIVGGGAVLAGLLFLLFSGWQTAKTVEFRDLAYSVESEREVTVDFEVTAPAQARVACTIEALSTSYATVGGKTFELGISDQRTRRFSQTLVTTYPATTGTVRACWVVAESE